MSKKPTVLMVLDGYGLNDRTEGNAIAMANTPVMDKLMKECPFVIFIMVSGVWVTDSIWFSLSINRFPPSFVKKIMLPPQKLFPTPREGRQSKP